MKRTMTILLALSITALTGCGDKEAREYAAKLIPVLDGYQQQLGEKIKAEQQAYQAANQRFAREATLEITRRLEAERDARSEELGDVIARDEKPPTMSEILKALQDYGDRDFTTTEGLLAASMDARSRYLNELETLAIEQQKIKLLKESLGELARAKKDTKEFKEAAAFLQKTQAEMTKLACDNSPRQPVDQNLKRLSEKLFAGNCN